MSVQEVTEMWSRKSSDIASSDGRTFTATYQRAFQVVHTPDTTQDQIKLADGIPRLRSFYPGTQFVFCSKVGPVQTVSPIMSVVPVQYSGEIGPEGDNDSPLNKPPDISWSNAATQEPIDSDAFGLPFTNSLGFRAEGFTKSISDFVLSIKRNFAFINIYAISQYLDSVNSDTFAGWPAGTAKFDTFSATQKITDELGYWEVQAKIIFRIPYLTTPLRAWWSRYRNESFYVVQGAALDFNAPQDSEGTPAAALLKVESGAITDIVMTSAGSKYAEGEPNPSIIAAGGGTGASFQFTVDSETGAIKTAEVLNGGSGYSKSGLVRAVDSNKQPVTEPIPISLAGLQIQNENAAVFLERPKYANYLPYNALGLL